MGEAFDRPPWYYADFDLRIVNERLVDIHKHWLSIRGAADLPAIDDFDPLDLVRHLGHLFVVRVETDRGDSARPKLRYTLIGTHIVEVLGRDTTGALIPDTFPDGHPVESVYHHAIARRIPFRTHGRLDWVNKKYRSFESILLPLVDGTGRIGKFVGSAVYETGGHPIVEA